MKDATFQYSRGYTLVELLLVMAIVGILSTVGISSFNSYNQNQNLTNATNELYSGINSAKSRAQSQVKPDAGRCTYANSHTLDGYQISIYKAPNGNCSSASVSCYEITPVCGGQASSAVLIEDDLPKDVTVNSSATFQFDVLTGQVPAADPNTGISVVLISGSRTRTISVFQDGRVTLN